MVTHQRSRAKAFYRLQLSPMFLSRVLAPLFPPPSLPRSSLPSSSFSSVSPVFNLSVFCCSLCFFFVLMTQNTSNTGGQLRTEGDLGLAFLAACFVASDAPPPFQFVTYYLSLPLFPPSSIFFTVTHPLPHPLWLLGNPTNWNSSANWTQQFLTDCFPSSSSSSLSKYVLFSHNTQQYPDGLSPPSSTFLLSPLLISLLPLPGSFRLLDFLFFFSPFCWCLVTFSPNSCYSQHFSALVSRGIISWDV